MSELKRYKAYEFGSAYVYHINEVDALIAEKDAEIAKLKVENENLKESNGFLRSGFSCGEGFEKLKAFELKVGKNLETDSPLVVGVDNKWNSRIMSGEEVYLKSEADKEISDLKRLNHDLCERVTENDEIRQHWEEIEQTKAENARLKAKFDEKDAETAQLQAMLEERNSQIAKQTQSLEQVKRAARTLRKKMNHWKRKFCEAMARERGIAAQMQHDFSMRYENPLYVKRAEWCEKWRDIWKSLIDKFKEAK